MPHPEPLKPVPQDCAANHPLPPGPEFPGCKPVHLPCTEIETYEGRLEFWDARTETAWVCEPTSPYHEQPSQTLAGLVHAIAGVRGSPRRLLGRLENSHFNKGALAGRTAPIPSRRSRLRCT